MRNRFVTLDIIPNLNLTWSTTLGNIENAKKAIRDRGWGPQNYKLLDHPSFQVLNTSNTNDFMSRPNTTRDFPTILLDEQNINRNGEIVLSKLDSLVENRLKSDARKRKYDAMLSSSTEQVSNFKSVSEMLSITSGVLCANGEFNLSNPKIRDRLQQLNDEKDKLKSEKDGRANDKQSKHDTKFRLAANKFFLNKETLRCDDIRVLLREISTKKDKAIEKNYAGKMAQLQHRKDRLKKYDTGFGVCDVGGNINKVVEFVDNNGFSTEIEKNDFGSVANRTQLQVSTRLVLTSLLLLVVVVVALVAIWAIVS